MKAHRLLLPLLILSSVPFAQAADWITYENAKLEAGYYDGDSFKVRTKTATAGRATIYVFRLYGADCCETDTRYPDRLAAQAADFRIPVEKVVEWGEKAKEFTAKFLAKPFTVHTMKTDARGASGQNRYYAIVVGADGRDLAESLVRAGLARAYGMWPDILPKGSGGDRYRSRLERVEAQARTDHAGIWGGNEVRPAATPSIFKSKLPFSD